MSLFAHNKKRQERPAKKPAAPAYTPFPWQEDQVLSPVNANVLPLSESQDPLFAQGKVGTGVILFPAGDTIKSPAPGKVLMVFPTKSSISIEDDKGREILLHLGMGTSKLNGKPFTCYVEPGQSVECGQPLMKADWDEVIKEGCSSELAVVLPKKEHVHIPEQKSVREGAVLFEIIPDNGEF